MRVLAADIGGTNSRFALFDTEPLRLLDMVRLSSAVPDFPTLLDRLAEEKPDMAPETADRLSFAVAGPIEEVAACAAGRLQCGLVNSRGFCPVRARLSNLPWVLDLEEARRHRPFGPALLVNDFEAQAWACMVPGVLDGALSLLPGEKCSAVNTPRALIGAGTGLGMALLIPLGGGEHISPSEGGHMAFPFVDREERAFGDFVAARRGVPYARGDDVVTGPGLALLYEFLTGRRRETAEFTADPDFHLSPVCSMFARFYARAARTLALVCLPLEGLILTGGLAANRPVLVDSDDFRREFLNSPAPHREVLARIPVKLNINQMSGLWGAARAVCG